MSNRTDILRERLLVIVDGVRTPFAKSFTTLAGVPADELGRVALTALFERAGVEPARIDEVVMGNVSGPAESSNVSRVIALRAGVPQDRVAHTVNRNCASGMESLVAAWQTLREERAGLVVAGGTESMSNVPLLWDRRMAAILGDLARAKSAWQKLKVLARIRPKHLKPIPAIQLGLTDPVCGLGMGNTAEVLAREFGITREQQDEFALGSHQKASAAQERCFLSGEIAAIPAEVTHGPAVEKDNGPRANQTLEALAKLKPIFERDGTVTAGNSCPLTDGAAAVLLTTRDGAQRLDREPLGMVTAYAIAGCDPRRMGLGPVFATHKLLRDTGLSLADIDLIEINEAFAAQVLACVKAFGSDNFAKHELGVEKAMGEIDPERLNVNGGAIALGHPVGTSGTRLVLTLARALKARGLKRGLATLCVGGGQGMAMLVERD